MDSAQERSSAVAIVHGYVVPVSSPAVADGTVLVIDGVIREVGTAVAIPDGARVIDATGHWVLPGFIDAHTHLGIHEESVGMPGNDTNESSVANAAGVRALDAVNINDEGFRDAARAGITTVSVKPGSANPFGGQTVIMKTAGGRTIDEQVMVAAASVKSGLGENPKQVWGAKSLMPVTRMGTAASIRQALEDARNYARQVDQAAQGGAPVPVNLHLAALSRMLAGDAYWDVHAHRHDDIATALRLAEEFGVRLVLNHGTQAQGLAEIIADRGVPVAVGPVITSRSKQELAGHEVGTAAALTAAGVKVAIITDHPEVPVNLLSFQAMLAVQAGLPRDAALEAITLNPAEVMGLAGRIGCLRPGADGDVVVWSGDPLTLEARALEVLINGVTVHSADQTGGLS